MIKEKNYRPMSNAARLWVAAESLWPTFCNNMVIEGAGSISLKNMEDAVKRASDVNTGARFIAKGIPGRGRCVDSGVTPPVIEIKDSSWSGYDLNGADFYKKKLDVHKGPSCEVLLIRGNPERIVFRTHHAIMDGKGTMTWAEDIFRALRNEKLSGSDSFAVEDDLLNVSPKIEKIKPGHYIIPAGHAEPGDGFVLSRRRVNGKIPHLLSRMMILVAREAWRHQKGRVRIAVPVDLRYRRSGLRATGNLANASFFEINADTTTDKLFNEILIRLKNKNDGSLTWEDRIVKYIPVSIIAKSLKRESELSKKTGHYRYSGVVSNVGYTDIDLFSSDEFKAESFFLIPPGNDWSPFFMVLTGTDSFVEITLTLPYAYGGSGRVDEILDRIVQGLKE